MARPKRTKTEREKALALVAELDGRGWTQRQIAKELGVSAPMVCYDLKQVRRRYAASTLESRAALVNEKLAELRQIKAEAWDAWERSCLDAVQVVDEKVLRNGKTRKRPTLFDADPSPDDDELTTVRQVTTTHNRPGDPRFLAVVLQAQRDERALLGLDMPARVEEQTMAIPWRVLVVESPAAEADGREAIPVPATSGDATRSRNGDGHE